MMSVEHDLLTIERKLWTGGPEAYRSNLEPSCLVAFKEMAGAMPREDIAKGAEKGRWRDISMEPKGLVSLGDDAVILTYECVAKRQNDETHRAFVSSGYVKRPSGWKLAFHQQTARD